MSVIIVNSPEAIGVLTGSFFLIFVGSIGLAVAGIASGISRVYIRLIFVGLGVTFFGFFSSLAGLNVSWWIWHLDFDLAKVVAVFVSIGYLLMSLSSPFAFFKSFVERRNGPPQPRIP